MTEEGKECGREFVLLKVCIDAVEMVNRFSIAHDRVADLDA